MSKTAVVTARLDEESLAILDRVASAHGKSRAAFAAEAISRVAREEAEFLAFVQEGIDSIEREGGIPHDVVMAELDRMIASHRARCQN